MNIYPEKETMSSRQEDVMMIVNDEMSPELQFVDTLQSRQLATIRPLVSSVDDDQCGCARTDDGECGCLRDRTEKDTDASPA
jgi:hypothetical protein